LLLFRSSFNCDYVIGGGGTDGSPGGGGSSISFGYDTIYTTGYQKGDGTAKITFFSSPDYSSSDGLQLWYPMIYESINGTTLGNYASGNPTFDATLINNPSMDDAYYGLRDSTALYLQSALYQSVLLPSFATLNQGLSIAFWFRCSSTCVPNAHLFDFGNGPNNDNIFFTPNPGLFQATIGSTYIPASSSLSSPSSCVSGNKWCFLVITMSYAPPFYTNSKWVVYLNGSVTASSGANLYPTAITREVNYLGKSNWVGNPYYNGYIGDFRVYQTVLTLAEIQSLYSAITLPSSQPSGQPSSQPSPFIGESLKSGLVAYYSFNRNANDKSGNGNHGVIHGGVSPINDHFGFSNSAYQFSGGYIEIPGKQFNFRVNMSACFWIKPVASQGDWATIFDKSAASAVMLGWQIYQTAAETNNFHLSTFHPSFNQPAPAVKLSTAVWSHYCVTKSPNRFKLYLNGYLNFSAVASAPMGTNGNLPLIIGARNTAVSSPADNLQLFYSGGLDEIFIFNRTISSREVLSLFNFESPTSQPSAQPSRLPTTQPTRRPSTQPSSFPSRQPTSVPTRQPTGQPFAQPSNKPTAQPSFQPSAIPSMHPSSQPTNQPTEQPSSHPTGQPTSKPSSQPSKKPSSQPSRTPTNQPTVRPSGQPSSKPTNQPSSIPTSQPSEKPSGRPSVQPTNRPSTQPSAKPTRQPTMKPSSQPTSRPSRQPSSHPSSQPTGKPSCQPSVQPTLQPSTQPTSRPTEQPTTKPSSQPSQSPSSSPSNRPTTQPTDQPSSHPTVRPSVQPSSQPSSDPSRQPSGQPTETPTSVPSTEPTNQPSSFPTNQPTGSPSTQPTSLPTVHPTSDPSSFPSSCPTTQPSLLPSTLPTVFPSSQPSSCPSIPPSSQPSSSPTSPPTNQPTGQPISLPTVIPSNTPSVLPSNQPTSQPSNRPTIVPSAAPSSLPSTFPTEVPTTQPSFQPSSRPTDSPTSQPSHCPSSQPTIHPTTQPTRSPSSIPTNIPSSSPSSQPTSRPSPIPSVIPSSLPSVQPSSRPSCHPSTFPTANPRGTPTYCPSVQPSSQPSTQPTGSPTSSPTSLPRSFPSSIPSSQPSFQPLSCPTRQPTTQPSSRPSKQPFARPTSQPTRFPSRRPTSRPSALPTLVSVAPTPVRPPSISAYPTQTKKPTRIPSIRPTLDPTAAPTATLSVLSSVSTVSQHFQGFVFQLGIYSLAGLVTQNIRITQPFLADAQSYVIFGRKEFKTSFINLQDSSQSYSYARIPSSLPSSSGIGIIPDSISRTVAMIGDINGDSFDDLLIGDPVNSKCYGYLGNENGFVNLPLSFTIVSESGTIGWSIARVGNLNSDNFDDFMISSSSTNTVFILYGRPLFPNELQIDSLSSSDGFKIIGSSSDTNFGMAISLAGDFNGDKQKDFLISAIDMKTSRPIIYIILGNDSQQRINILLDSIPKTAFLKIIAPLFSFAGLSLSGLGDVNADGFDDTIIGSVPYQGRFVNQKSYLIYGRNHASSSSSSEELLLSELTEEDGMIIYGGGFVVTGPGDVNNDGINDIVVIDYQNWQGKSNAYLLVYPVKMNITSPPSFQPSSQPSSSPSSAPSTEPTVKMTFSTPTNVPTVPPLINDFPNNDPTLAPKSKSPSRMPTIRPSSRTPSFRPSLNPSQTSKNPTRIPSRLPTVKPSLLPSSPSPSFLPTIKPSLPSRMPSSFPSLAPSKSLDSPLVVFRIEDSGNYEIPEDKQELIVSATGNIQLSGGKNVLVYKILPISAENSSVVTIIDFNVHKNLLDLSEFSSIKSLSDLSFTTNPLTIILSGNQRVVLSSYSDFQLTEKNFIFSSTHSNQQDGSGKGDGYQGITLDSSFFISLGILLGGVLVVICFLTAVKSDKDKEEEKEELQGKYSTDQITNSLDGNRIVDGNGNHSGVNDNENQSEADLEKATELQPTQRKVDIYIVDDDEEEDFDSDFSTDESDEEVEGVDNDYGDDLSSDEYDFHEEDQGTSDENNDKEPVENDLEEGNKNNQETSRENYYQERLEDDVGNDHYGTVDNDQYGTVSNYVNHLYSPSNCYYSHNSSNNNYSIQQNYSESGSTYYDHTGGHLMVQNSNFTVGNDSNHLDDYYSHSQSFNFQVPNDHYSSSVGQMNFHSSFPRHFATNNNGNVGFEDQETENTEESRNNSYKSNNSNTGQYYSNYSDHSPRRLPAFENQNYEEYESDNEPVN
jgi:hypothetical protein